MKELHLTPRELAERWKLGNSKNDRAGGVGTLANWRSANPRKGPPFIKFGRRVLYRLSDIEAYEAARFVTVNGEYSTDADK